MSNKKEIGKEILGHLELCRDLGVRWMDVPRAASGARSQKGPKSAPAGPASAPHAAKAASTLPARQPAKAASGTIVSKVSFDNRSMFDELPVVKETLDEIRTNLGDCRRCKLAPLRTHIVFGSGNPNAELMFVGEAPGADEDAQGLPFVGRAGQLLTKIIEAIGMKREDVYICNILKCRPPENRNPESDEIAACEPFLFSQISSVKPRVICALGTFGAQTLLRTKEPISRLRGYFIDYRGTKFMATFHPAYLLRNPNEKRKVWEDVRKIRDYLHSLHESS